MRSKEASRRNSKSILAMILDSYQEYCNFNYPKDPKVYTIKAHPDTIKLLEMHLSQGAILKDEKPVEWGFKLEPDSRLFKYEVIFGPEQITIKWDGK